MIGFVFGQNRLHTLTIIFYTCVWLPLSHLKEAMLNAVRAVFGPFGHMEAVVHEVGLVGTDELDGILTVKFEEFEGLEETNGDGVCSICLGEFEREELVSRLPGCRHLFHAICITRWLDWDRFTCPLCRSLIFQ